MLHAGFAFPETSARAILWPPTASTFYSPNGILFPYHALGRQTRQSFSSADCAVCLAFIAQQNGVQCRSVHTRSIGEKDLKEVETRCQGGAKTPGRPTGQRNR